jgi:hypothetical protein
MSEKIPVITDLDGPERDEVTVLIEIDDPPEDEVLRLYRTYRDSGGEPYEPYESMMRDRDNSVTEAPA